MTTPPDMAIRRAAVARASLADRHTPFIFDAWYVAAFANEIGRSLLKRRLLGRDVVLYRTSDGEAVGLEDRCAHRSFPLSAGRLDGDVLVCGYHGFRYDRAGDVVDIPSQDRCPPNIGVRRYALIERGALVWIWMGDAAAADPSSIPALDWAQYAGWKTTQGYYDLPCNYISLHENLLDLTHIEFLHAQTLGRGSPGYAASPFETQTREGYYALTRTVAPTRLPPIFARTTGLGDIETAARAICSEFLSPACHQVNAAYYDTAAPESDRPEYELKTAHLPTPQDHDSTHYFILHGWNFGLDDADAQAIMHDNLFAAFNEDVDGLTLLQQVLEQRDSEPDFYEISVGSDAAAVEMRQYLKRQANLERV